MAAYDPRLEPFAPHTLRAIQTAFHAGWSELRRAGLTADADRTRNRLAGTIANLARKGILDPRDLKDQALRALSAVLGLSSMQCQERAQAEASR
jgi:hypothetical protein